MNHHITVRFGDDQTYELEVSDAETASLKWEHAQQWIDAEYVGTEYEADNPVGIALLADKILCVAAARGPRVFAEDSAWTAQFARCIGTATGRINIDINVADRTVEF